MELCPPPPVLNNHLGKVATRQFKFKNKIIEREREREREMAGAGQPWYMPLTWPVGKYLYS